MTNIAKNKRLQNLIELCKLVHDGFTKLSTRGKFVVVLSSASLLVLSVIDIGALYLLSSVFKLSSSTFLDEIVIDTTAQVFLIVIVLFALRSALSSVVSFITAKEMAKDESQLGIDAFTNLVNPLTLLSGSPATHFHNEADRGPQALVKIILNLSFLLSEFITAIALLGFFLVMEPLIATFSVFYFASTGAIQYKTLSNKVRRLGLTITNTTNRVYQILDDAAQLRKVLSTASQKSIITALSKERKSLSDARGISTFLMAVPRYLVELNLALGLLFIGGIANFVYGPAEGLSIIILFTGVSLRLLPITNQIQILVLATVGGASTAQLSLVERPVQENHAYERPFDSTSFIELSQVDFKYPNSETNALLDVSFNLEHGKQYAVIGRSGSGKTTLVDILLGLLNPSSGSLRRHGDFRAAYVPQDTYLAFASVAKNVALEWDSTQIDMGRVEIALRHAGLREFLSRINDPEPLTNSSLSGGQKQRIGLARALYLRANFIAFDEVTSALDAETEKSVVEQIYELRGDVTAVVVAHRLSTVQHADHVFYLENGRIIGSDTFQRLFDTLPQFRQQIEFGQIRLGD